MNAITPFQFENQNVRIQQDNDGQPWFNANDVCAALEYVNPRDALSKHVDPECVAQRDALDGRGLLRSSNFINESGLYSLILGSEQKAAKRFKLWVTREVLPALAKTGSYSFRNAGGALPFDAIKLYPLLVDAARATGLDINAAAISANQAAMKLTGDDVLLLLGRKHLLAPVQEYALTPTELGKRLNGEKPVSPQAVNKMLAEAGLQTKQGDKWVPTKAADGLYRFMDTMKRQADGVPVLQLKWFEKVLAIVKTQEAA